MLGLTTAERNIVKGHNIQYQLVLSDVQSLETGGGHYARATISPSEHSPACVFITGRLISSWPTWIGPLFEPFRGAAPE